METMSAIVPNAVIERLNLNKVISAATWIRFSKGSKLHKERTQSQYYGILVHFLQSIPEVIAAMFQWAFVLADRSRRSY